MNPMSRSRLIVLFPFLALGLAVAGFVLLRRGSAPLPEPAPVAALGQFTVPPQAGGKILRPQLAEALGGTSPWKHRTDLIRALSVDLTADETEAMLMAMMERCPQHVDPGVHSTYMHEIALQLQNQTSVRERFARALATIARDTKQDASTRNYAIQHLRHVWARSAGDPGLRAATVLTFRELTRLDPVVSVPSLLSLHLLGSASEQRAAEGVAAPLPTSAKAVPAYFIPDAEITPLLDPIFATANSRDNLAARVTAMRIIGERRIKSYRPLLLQTVADRSGHAVLRMAAVGAIGNIAEPEDLKLLATLQPGDERVASALRHALRPGVGH